MTSTRIIMSYPWKNTGEKLKQSQQEAEDLGITEAVQKIARKELREDKSTREQCLQQLRNWIKKNEDIEDVRTDDRFLLRFLRVKKYSVPMAQQCILKYLNLKKTFPYMAANLDFLSPALNDIICSGYIFVSPIRDRHGRRVVIACASNFNPKIHKSVDIARAHFLTYETLLEEPENQVLGFSHVGDFSGITAAHVTSWNPTDFARIMKWGEQSVPVRHKGIHLVNVPPSVKWVLDFVKSRVTPKMKDRFHAYVNVKELYKHVDPACLPLEMGGKIPMKDMVESWKRELATKRDLLLALDNMKIHSDRDIITSRDKNNNSMKHQMESITGSFRKLELD